MYKRIRELREDNDFSQKEIAKVLKTTQQFYYKYEKGIIPLTLERAKELAIFYNTSIDYIVGLTNEKVPYKRA